MKKYYVDGKQISKEEATEIKQINERIVSSGNIEDWLDCKFVVEVEA